jgi:trehalose-6-phosphate hydrolase
VLNNFFPQETTIDVPEEFAAGQVLIDNYSAEVVGKELTLKPYQSLAIYR